MKKSSLSNLRTAITEAARATFAKLRNAHQGETFYALPSTPMMKPTTSPVVRIPKKDFCSAPSNTRSGRKKDSGDTPIFYDGVHRTGPIIALGTMNSRKRRKCWMRLGVAGI